MNTAPKTIDEYIKQFPLSVQERLNKLRQLIIEIAPEARQSISYGMPTFKLNGKPLIYFAAFPNHIGLYALPDANIKFKKELTSFHVGKGSIQSPLDKPMPYDLITKIVQFRVKNNLEKE